jgi:rubrerythrin
MAMKIFTDLTEREVLAVAISSEEEDGRIDMLFAENLKERYPGTAKVFEEMADEERGHRHRLLETYENRFGTHLPPIRREDVKGLLRRRPVWLTKNLPLDTIRKEVETMEQQAGRFLFARRPPSRGRRRAPPARDLAEEEKEHENLAGKLADEHLHPAARGAEDKTSERTFVLQYVQPGLAGLMDGSSRPWRHFSRPRSRPITTGRPSRSGWPLRSVRISAWRSPKRCPTTAPSRGAAPWLRGAICGAMTTVGGLGHSVPYLVPDSWPNAFWIATSIAGVVVRIVGNRLHPGALMDTPFLRAAFQVGLGGVIVLAVGIAIGAS